ncbi:DeoR/GlpR family DNA-binding transcription regulator [Neorhizobium sp. NCHU2750]|uniref:DeoR/GlpR family DNA-binding transcription regulator n=1 Tax=Neorhizobium sp. NCHU2750 TaxID=1825976 RepID=UPI0013C4985A
MTIQSAQQSLKISRAERLRLVLSAIRVNSSVRLSSLAEEFAVSQETIRRDLEKLHSQGLISRTYGGAMAYAPGRDPSFSERMETNVQVRDALAQEAVKLVQPGDVLFISSGVTSLQFAEHLAQVAEDLTVLTTSVRVASAFFGREGVRVLLAPGEFDAVEQSVSGAETQAFFSKFHGTKLFFGASGLTADGPNESRSPIAWNLRAMIGRVEQVILIADQSKFGIRHLETISELADIDILVTNQMPDEQLMEAIDEAAIELRLVNSQN